MRRIIFEDTKEDFDLTVYCPSNFFEDDLGSDENCGGTNCEDCWAKFKGKIKVEETL